MTVATNAPIFAAAISAGATLITAVFVVFYARRQARIAADKLALDLFEKRLTNFQKWRDMIGRQFQAIIGSTDLTPVATIRFNPDWLSSTSDARFLFGKAVHDRLVKITGILDEMAELPRWKHDDLIALRDRYLIEWAEIRVVVDSYLMLDHIGLNKSVMKRERKSWAKRAKDEATARKEALDRALTEQHEKPEEPSIK